MSRFIESIRIANGIIENLSLHQERLDRALREHSASTKINLEDHILTDQLSDQIVYKCRVVYDLNGIEEVQYLPYNKRKVTTLGLVRDNSIDYHQKYANRDHINQLLSNSDTDDIVIIKNGFVTDASYTNLVFYDGSEWYTSNTPLLQGVRREQLIRNGTIKERVIKETDIKSFVALRMINAMIPWEEAIEIPITSVKQSG